MAVLDSAIDDGIVAGATLPFKGKALAASRSAIHHFLSHKKQQLALINKVTRQLLAGWPGLHLQGPVCRQRRPHFGAPLL
jgi:hypothetical protein